MIGYHYTSLQAWQEIKASGYLKPQPISRPEITRLSRTPGIWLFTERQDRWHAMFTMIKHRELSVVELACEYTTILPRVEGIHTGHFDSPERVFQEWTYHKAAYIIHTKKIPLTSITVIEEFELVGYSCKTKVAAA